MSSFYVATYELLAEADEERLRRLAGRGDPHAQTALNRLRSRRSNVFLVKWFPASGAGWDGPPLQPAEADSTGASPDDLLYGSSDLSVLSDFSVEVEGDHLYLSSPDEFVVIRKLRGPITKGEFKRFAGMPAAEYQGHIFNGDREWWR